MRSIWSKLAEENRLIAVNDLKIDEPAKSSQVKTILADLGLTTALIVLSSSNDNLNKASKEKKQVSQNQKLLALLRYLKHYSR